MPPKAYNDDMENLLVEHLQEREPGAPAGHDHRAYGLAAEVRAVEEGHNARVLPDGSVLVKAESGPGSYRVTVRAVDDGILRLGSTCRSGADSRRQPGPRKH